MSVLKNKRHDSKILFVDKAKEIYTRTISFISHLSTRMARIYSNYIIDIVSSAFGNTIKASEIWANDKVKYDLKESYILQAMADFKALDYSLLIVHDVLMANPSQSFENSKNKPMSRKLAEEKIEQMSNTIGDLLNEEARLLNGLLRSNTEAMVKAGFSNKEIPTPKAEDFYEEEVKQPVKPPRETMVEDSDEFMTNNEILKQDNN